METKVAIVTGAARGIGLATTHMLIEDGFRVAMVDRDIAAVEEAAAALDAALALPTDVSDSTQVDAMIAKTIAHFGRIDALINNAGVADFGPIEETSFERWRTVMATNLDGVFLCSQAAVPALKKTKGCIVNIASISGLRASTLRVAYGTSKAGVIHLTKQQAAELAEYGIRANCVAPGPIWTPFIPGTMPAEMVEDFGTQVPMGRPGQPWEVATSYLFLASDDGSYFSGQTLHPNGGMIVGS